MLSPNPTETGFRERWCVVGGECRTKSRTNAADCSRAEACGVGDAQRGVDADAVVGVGRRERGGCSRVGGGFGASRANSTVCLRASPPEAVTERFDVPEDRQGPLQTTRRAAASACGLRRWLAVVVVLIAVGSAGGSLACAPATAAGLGQTGPVWSARSPQAATPLVGTGDRGVGTLSAVALALTVTGSGDVTSAPTDISCGASAVQCTAIYDSAAATSVTLTATPQPGEVFLGWYGDTCTGAASTCVVTMSAAKSITASFTGRSSYALAVAVSGSGVVAGAPSTIDCNEAGTPVCAQALTAGSTVTLTAEPSAGSAFAGWGGACAGSGSTCTVTVIAAASVTARFVVGFRLSVEASEGGSVVADGGVIDCTSDGSACAQGYASGTVVLLTAAPDSGYAFAGWTGACTGATLTCRVTMRQTQSSSASFVELVPLTVDITGRGSVSSSPNGITECTSTCATSFSAGTEVTLTARPGSNRDFLRWRGACSGRSTTCTISMLDAHAVYAKFVATNAELTLTLEPSLGAVHPEQPFQLHFNLTNEGATAALSTRACATVPRGFVVTSAGAGRRKGNQLCFVVGTLKPQRSRRLTIGLHATSAAADRFQFVGHAVAANARGRNAGSAISSAVMLIPGTAGGTGPNVRWYTS